MAGGQLIATVPGPHRYIGPTLAAQAGYVHSWKLLRSHPAKHLVTKFVTGMYRRIRGSGEYPPTPRPEKRQRTEDTNNAGPSRISFSENMPIRTRSNARRFRRVRFYMRYKRRQRNTGRGVTAQYDRQGIYRYKRMPRRKKGQWLSLSKKVNAVIDSSLAPRQVVFNSAMVGNDAVAQQQLYFAALGGLKGSLDDGYSVGFGDLWRILYNDPDTIKTVGPNVRLNLGKVMLTNMVMDITFFNSSPFDGPKRKEVDVYELVAKNGDYPNLFVKYFVDVQNQSVINPAEPGYTLQTRGVTPFDIANASNEIKILKKTKFFVETGSTFTYQVRVPRNKVLDCKRVQSLVDTTNEQFVGNCNYAGITKYLMFVVKNCDGSTVTGNEVRIGCTRSYYYKVLKWNQANRQLLNGSAAYP